MEKCQWLASATEEREANGMASNSLFPNTGFWEAIVFPSEPVCPAKHGKTDVSSLLLLRECSSPFCHEGLSNRHSSQKRPGDLSLPGVEDQLITVRKGREGNQCFLCRSCASFLFVPLCLVWSLAHSRHLINVCGSELSYLLMTMGWTRSLEVLPSPKDYGSEIHHVPIA